MRSSRFTLEEFLELQKTTEVKLHFRDACGSTVIEIEEPSEEMKKHIEEFFKNKAKEVEFSNDGKFVFEKRV